LAAAAHRRLSARAAGRRGRACQPAFSLLTKIAAVSQYQIMLEANGLNVRLVVAAEAAADAVAREVAGGLAEVLRSQAAAALPVRVRVVEAIERESGAGKFKLIKSNVPPKPQS
jgi:phenylacetate-coenzyme A ligase PaaK-like adenylate-forming protein